jgi:hypothetical protein
MRRGADGRHLISADEAAVRLQLFHEPRSSTTVRLLMAMFTLLSLIEVSRVRQHPFTLSLFVLA